MNDTKTFEAYQLGIIPYEKALIIQEELILKLRESPETGYLLFLRHPHVYTLGKRGKHDDILETVDPITGNEISIIQSDRGGLVTYHGPNQLICYPIFNLKNWGGVKKYVKTLEKTILTSLEKIGVENLTTSNKIGVWVKTSDSHSERKIAFIGIKVSKGITSHGFSINVKSCEEYFQKIIPCGIPNLAITSIDEENGDITDLSKLENIIADSVSENFHVPIIWKNTLTLSSI